jgi:transposase
MIFLSDILYIVETGGVSMRLKCNVTAKGKCYYIIRSVYKNGKNTSEIVEKLGYPEDVKEKYNCEDPMKWMHDRLDEMNAAEEDSTKVLVPFQSNILIQQNRSMSFNCGYLFLQKIYYELKIDLICKHISSRHGYAYDMNSILSALIFGRILFPGSKLATCKQAVDMLEFPQIEYHNTVRALSVIAKEFYAIQAELYKYSAEAIPRRTGVLYYDCTNFYFETEEEDAISNDEADRTETAARKYGKSKQHQPSPLVQMGMFMDYSGIPLAICINRGNKNEQQTLIPLEEKILSDFELSKFVVCTDAGLSSDDNRMFNNFGERSFVTTVSIKKMKADLQEWCLEPTGWHLEGSDELFDLRTLEDSEESKSLNHSRVFYKEKYIEGYDAERDIEFNQTLIVTYSLKYKYFLKHKRESQVQRALNAINSDHSALKKTSSHDYRRFVSQKATDKKGKSVNITYELDQEAIDEEAKYDGFYAVETNLDDSVSDIIKINSGRWEIEESFRIMKDDFKSRPAYLSRSDRIKAHFMTCFMSLLVYRVLEKKLGCKYTCEELLQTLRNMRMTKVQDVGYIPSYTRTEITDCLHETAGFRTDYEITRQKSMHGIIRKSKAR